MLYGYSVAFGDDLGGGLLGDPGQLFGLKGMMVDMMSDAGGLPAMAFVAFQRVFAVITVALISGAVADRARLGPWLVLTGVWATLGLPSRALGVRRDRGRRHAAHVGGWIVNRLGALDFAGGTAVHVNAGAAGLALARCSVGGSAWAESR